MLSLPRRRSEEAQVAQVANCPQEPRLFPSIRILFFVFFLVLFFFRILLSSPLSTFDFIEASIAKRAVPIREVDRLARFAIHAVRNGEILDGHLIILV